MENEKRHHLELISCRKSRKVCFPKVAIFLLDLSDSNGSSGQFIQERSLSISNSIGEKQKSRLVIQSPCANRGANASDF